MAIKPLPTDQSAYVATDGKPATVFYTWLKSLAEALSGLLALFPGGTTSAAWTSYTPTVTAGTGTITSSTATGRSYQIGKVVFFQFDVVINNRGTGLGGLIVTLPVAPAAFAYAFAGAEPALNDLVIQGTINVDDPNVAHILYYDGSTLVLTGARVVASGVYEAA